MQPNKHVIFLTGAIGAGKSTIGRALADELEGSHVEGDDHQRPPKPWYATSLSTCRGTLREVVAKLELRNTVVVSYPLRCFEWIFYRRHLASWGVRSTFITLVAGYDATVDPSRGRVFSDWEKARIREMLDEGYDRPRFSDHVISSEKEPPAANVKRVLAQIAQRARSTAPAQIEKNFDK